MDLTETFRSEDISKTDFFDFVVGPDASDSQQFTKQMRAVNAYLGNSEPEQKETSSSNGMTMEVLPPQSASSDGSSNTAYDPTFWSCDKDTVRLESAILDDLNKYCWSQQEDAGTDGHIYTLTVLNGVDQNPSWYRPPLSSLGIVKEEDVSMSSPASLEQMQQQALDIDSILNIIPGGPQINGYSNESSGTVFLTSSGEQTLNSPNTDGLIKSETYTYEDSGYADNKDELANTMIIDTPMLEAHDGYNNNNNNDWKINNNNSNSTIGSSSGAADAADSLLRSALQGKAFVRYNGTATKVSKESHSELKRALSTPPSTEKPEEETALVSGIDTSAILFVDGTRLVSSETTPSTHSVDDILLSQLEAASYPEDYEKLKRIANEVAESVQQYCQLDPIYTLGNSDQQVLPAGIQTVQVSVTSTKPTTPKKYKRSNSGSGSRSSTVAGATSTSNGVRKERSLHYCSICSKGFKDKYSVNVHIRTHTGEKPFACSLCGKSFRQKAHLAKHYQTHIAQKNAAAASTPKAGSKATR